MPGKPLNQSYINTIYKIKDKFKPVIMLLRLDNRIGLWLVILPGIMGIILAERVYGHISNKVGICALFVIALIARSCFCAINDIWDAKFDANIARCKDRSIPSGRITRFKAAILAGLLALACVTLGYLMLDRTIFIYCIISGIMCTVYPMLKRFFQWPQLFLGIAINSLCLIVWLYATNMTHNIKVYLLMLALILWTTAYDTVYGMMDRAEDEKQNLKSMAICVYHSKLGPKICISTIYMASLVVFFILHLAITGINLNMTFVVLICLLYGALVMHTFLMQLNTTRGLLSPLAHFRSQYIAGIWICISMLYI